VRTDNQGNVVDVQLVPLAYARKEKMIARIEDDPTITRQAAVQLPRMSFELKGVKYDAERKLQTKRKIARSFPDNKNHLKWAYNLLPYTFSFELSIYSKNAEDCAKIAEQIIPFFTPDWTGRVHLVPELDITMNIPITLISIPPIEDNYDAAFKERRHIIWTFVFEMKGYLLGPIKDNAVIKFANTTFYIPDNKIVNIADAVGNTSPADRVTVSPGLTANGLPTSNLSLSIDKNLIIATDNFGFIDHVYGIITNEP
jgi:hypothetical protein